MTGCSVTAWPSRSSRELAFHELCKTATSCKQTFLRLCCEQSCRTPSSSQPARCTPARTTHVSLSIINTGSALCLCGMKAVCSDVQMMGGSFCTHTWPRKLANGCQAPDRSELVQTCGMRVTCLCRLDFSCGISTGTSVSLLDSLFLISIFLPFFHSFDLSFSLQVSFLLSFLVLSFLVLSFSFLRSFWLSVRISSGISVSLPRSAFLHLCILFNQCFFLCS